MRRDKKWTGFYSPDRIEVAAEIGDEPSRTRQEFAAECDINTIMAKYERTGVINHYNDGTPQYLDLVDTPSDLMSAMAVLHSAEEAFMRLPASVRKNFDNDVHDFITFAEDKENLEQMREWGLAPPAPLPDAPREVRIVQDDRKPADPPA